VALKVAVVSPQCQYNTCEKTWSADVTDATPLSTSRHPDEVQLHGCMIAWGRQLLRHSSCQPLSRH
jgi:hypothetical protein